MNASFWSMDRSTHLKVVLLSLAIAIVGGLFVAAIQLNELHNTLEANRGHEETVKISSAKLPD